MKTLLLTLFSIGGLLAQSTPPNQLQIYSPAPSPVRQIGGGTVGQSGSTTLYYWVIARYSSGVAVNTTPVAIFNTVGTANLTASNYVSITWGAVSGATGYDVLRSTTPIYPANPTCAGCAVTLNTPNSSITDTGAVLSDYPPDGLVQSSATTATIYIDNSNSVPYLNTQLLYRATENLIVGLISGSIANGDCIQYSNGRLVSAGFACGSGSGGGLPYPGIAVGLTSSTSAARTLIAGSNITITNPDGVSGDITIAATSGGAGSYTQSFTAQTSVTLTHNLGTKNLVADCFDNSDNYIEWNTFVTTSTSAATVTFTTAQTGRCVVAGGLAGAGDALTSNPLSQFAATTSDQLRGIMTDESGTGALLFAGGNIGAASGASLTLSGALTALSTSVGSSPPSVTAGTGGVEALGEGTAPSAGCPAAGVDCIYADSTAHALLASYNNDAASKLMRASDVATGYQPLDAALTALAGGSDFVQFSGPATSTKAFTLPNANATLSYTVASGAKALATGAISSAACTSAQTDTATGTATTDVVIASFNGDPTAVTGYVPLTTGMLTIIAYPTADTVNFKVCNNTSASITPGAITLNWRVIR